ncbi:hypothetical protein D3C80_1806700 [compost metagenome]
MVTINRVTPSEAIKAGSQAPNRKNTSQDKVNAAPSNNVSKASGGTSRSRVMASRLKLPRAIDSPSNFGASPRITPRWPCSQRVRWVVRPSSLRGK